MFSCSAEGLLRNTRNGLSCDTCCSSEKPTVTSWLRFSTLGTAMLGSSVPTESHCRPLNPFSCTVATGVWKTYMSRRTWFGSRALLLPHRERKKEFQYVLGVLRLPDPMLSRSGPLPSGSWSFELNFALIAACNKSYLLGAQTACGKSPGFRGPFSTPHVAVVRARET